jgi:hypothetical protein
VEVLLKFATEEGQTEEGRGYGRDLARREIRAHCKWRGVWSIRRRMQNAAALGSPIENVA